MAARAGWGLIAGLAVAALASGCKQTSSVDLMTGDISAEIRVSATAANASSVRVQMSPGSGVVPTDVVKLGGGDALYAEAAGQRKQLGAGTFDYETTFGTGAAETLFNVILDRPRPEQVDAPDSSGKLPPPFDLSDLGGASISEAQTVVLTWSPSGTADRMVLQIQGGCVEDQSITLDGDPGSYAPPLDFETIDSSCLVTLTLHRERDGVVDANLNPASTFMLEQVRQTQFRSYR
jgi:hypothetical protein